MTGSILVRLIGPRVAAASILFAGAAAQPFRPLVVVGGSMEPTYNSGEVLLTVPITRPLKRGDVVVADGPSGTIIKRVALVAGDRYLQVKIGKEWRDGVFLRPGLRDSLHILRTAVLPAGTVYLVGDNSSASVDSRTFGPLPLSKISRLVYRPKPYGTPDDAVAQGFHSRKAPIGRT